jgi:hypothetical protein
MQGIDEAERRQGGLERQKSAKAYMQEPGQQRKITWQTAHTMIS